MVVGHTPQMTKGINSLCNKKLWLTDIGVSKGFDKFDFGSDGSTRSNVRTASVLEILNNEIVNILK